MKLEQLRVLDAIVTQGSFRKASEVLYKSQPALSQAIKSLEEETGLTLLSRESYRPVLTPAGKAYYRQARGVLDQVQALKELAGNILTMQDDGEQVCDLQLDTIDARRLGGMHSRQHHDLLQWSP